jgi:DNA-binding IclR family transcriptional regulator
LTQARERDEALWALLRDQPGLTKARIAEATQSATSTLDNRLARLQAHNLVVRADGGGWSLQSTPT